MKKLLLLCLLAFAPLQAFAGYIAGIDDVLSDREPPVDKPTLEKLHASMLTYYKDPAVEKVDTVMDIMANTTLLDRKTAWPPMTGFLTVVFANRKDKVMRWMGRNDYNDHAQYVIVNALLHAKLKESAVLFAKAHKWNAGNMLRLREMDDTVNLKKLTIIVPGHIDTLWGAFMASGDLVYVDQIIDVLLTGKLPEYKESLYFMPEGSDPLAENKRLAAISLRDYARDHEPVRRALTQRYDAATDPQIKQLYKDILGN